MGSRDLKSEVRAVLKEAAHTADRADDNPPDRAELLRLVVRLKRALARLNRAHDELDVVYRAFTESLCRGQASTGPATSLSEPRGCDNRQNKPAPDAADTGPMCRSA